MVRQVVSIQIVHYELSVKASRKKNWTTSELIIISFTMKLSISLKYMSISIWKSCTYKHHQSFLKPTGVVCNMT